MVTWILVITAVLWLAWSNGANDNFKGVATLYGCGAAGYRQALLWATIATAAGSLASIVLAASLVQVFSGHGLIPESLQGTGALALAVGAAAGATIFLATVLGLPTSTTHALFGALVGVGFVASPTQLDWSVVGSNFAQPLLAGPLLAIAITVALYPLLRVSRRTLGVTRETCLCIDGCETRLVFVPESAGPARISSAARGALPVLTIDGQAACAERYQGRLVGVDAHSAVTAVHYFSGASVCFARSVNDTPKIAALLLLAGPAVMNEAGLLLIAAAMIIGGLMQSRRVAETMSRRITGLNPGQGLTANLVTAALVLVASRMGLPVSTTHVSCGSIFGIGLVSGDCRWKTVAQIGLAWVTTLPLALLLGAFFFSLASRVGI